MRNLLNRSYETLGLDQKIWLLKEAGGFGDESTAGLPQAAGAVEHLNFDATFNIPREDSASRSGRSVVVRLSKKKEVSFKCESYIIPGIPSGSNPTLPPLDPMILSAFGNVDLSNPAEIVYKLSQLNDKSFAVLEEMTHYSRLVVGMVADSLTFSLPGDGKAQMSAEGFAQDVYVAGESKLSAAATATNTLPVPAGEEGRFEPGSYVDVIDGSDGNTVIASARKVTGTASGAVTVDGAAITAAQGDFLIGHAPNGFSPVSSENALLGLKGAFSVNGAQIDCKLTMAEISLKNNFTKKDFIYGMSKICGYIPDKRRAVSVKLGLLLDVDTFDRYMRAKKFVGENLRITLEAQDIPAPAFTSSAGRTFQFDFPKVEFNVPKLEAPADKYVVLSLEGVALASSVSALDTELTLTVK